MFHKPKSRNNNCWIEWPQNNKEGGVELIIPKLSLIKNYSFKAFTKVLRE